MNENIKKAIQLIESATGKKVILQETSYFNEEDPRMTEDDDENTNTIETELLVDPQTGMLSIDGFEFDTNQNLDFIDWDFSDDGAFYTTNITIEYYQADGSIHSTKHTKTQKEIELTPEVSKYIQNTLIKEKIEQDNQFYKDSNTDHQIDNLNP